MQLHIGNLFWPVTTDVPSLRTCESLSEENRDVLVIGGGISGAISAYRLAKEGYKVTLVEQNTIGSGSSSANTGLIQYMSDKGVVHFIEQLDEEDAVRFYRQSIQAIRTLIAINEELESLGTDTFDLQKSIILATDENKYDAVKGEAKKQKELGFGASFLEREELKQKNIDAYGGLVADPDIGLNPYGFVYRLIEKAMDAYELEVAERTRFLQSEHTSEGQRVALENNGTRVERTFEKVIYATGYNPPEKWKHHLDKMVLYKTYVTVTKRDKAFSQEPDFLVWEVKNPYTYFRQTFDRRFMIGGMDVKGDTLTDEDADKNTGALLEKTIEMIDDKDIVLRPEYSYAAIFGESEDNLPYMGVNPDNPNEFIVCGVGGNGTVYSTIASEMALLWMKGGDLCDYSILRPGR